MPDRRSVSVPSYRRHKQSGQAVVTLRDVASWQRRDVLLGKHGTAASRAEYARVIAEWEAAGRRILETEAVADLTINELAASFWDHVENYYPCRDDGATPEADEYKAALKPMRALFGDTIAAEFGPLKLKAMREQMIKDGLSRSTINKRVWRVKKMFAWGAENELVPATVWHALLAVKGLARGRSGARETDPVKPVDEVHVTATLPFLPPPLRVMIRLQLLTGMRPGEFCRMRACDIDQSGPVWLYRPTTHKNAWRGKDRVVAIGPQGKLLLKPFLEDAEPAAFLFRPADAMAHLWRERREARVSKVQPSQEDRRKEDPEVQPGERYITQSYGAAIVYAIKRANKIRRKADAEPIPRWSPNQLRHAHGTTVRKQFGIEAAQTALGHETLVASQVYAERNLALAVKVAAEVG
jgi:integrase